MKLEDLETQINGMTKQLQDRELDKQVHESGDCRCGTVLGCQGHVRAIDGTMNLIRNELIMYQNQKLKNILKDSKQ